jgi:hypothetical protein
MKGTLTINERIYRDVYLESIDETDSIFFYQLNEDGKPAEVVHLQKAKYLISGEEVEITGFKCKGDTKKRKSHAPKEGATCMFIEAKFRPDKNEREDTGSMELREHEPKNGNSGHCRERQYVGIPSTMEFEKMILIKGNQRHIVNILKSRTKTELRERGEFVYPD